MSVMKKIQRLSLRTQVGVQQDPEVSLDANTEESESCENQEIQSPPVRGKTESVEPETGRKRDCKNVLQEFLAFLNYYRFGRQQLRNKFLQILLRCIQKLFWVAVVVLAILDSLALLKIFILAIKQHQRNASQSTYIETGAVMLRLCLRVKFLRMIIWNDEALASLVHLLKEKYFDSNGQARKHSWITPSMLFISSFGLALVYTLLGFDEIYTDRDWSFTGLVMAHYQYLYNTMFVWKQGEEQNFPEEITPTVEACSAFGFIVSFGATFTDFFLEDLFIIVALYLKLEVDKADRLRKEFENETDEDKMKILAMEIMNNYYTMQKISVVINGAFGLMITMLHGIYIFLCVAFSDEIINDPDIGGGMLKSTGIIKCSIAYSLCLSSTEEIQGLRSWFRDTRTRKALDMDTQTFCAILDEMKTSPIGIGSGEFYVNWQFVRKLTALMMSYFFIIAKSSQQREAASCNCNCNSSLNSTSF